MVIGNPPYVRQELIKDYSFYLEKNYASYSGKADLFVYFYELATKITKSNGLVSFISSGKFFEASYGTPLIDYLIKNNTFIEIIDFKDLEIFTGISAYPLILTFSKGQISNYTFRYSDATKAEYYDLAEIVQKIQFQKIDICDFISNGYKFIDGTISKIIHKVNQNSDTLKTLNLMPLVGVKTGFNDGYLNIPSTLAKKYIFGRDVKKYCSPIAENSIIFPYIFDNGQYELLQPNHIELNKLHNKSKLENRAIIKDGIKNGSKIWYEYQQINKSLNFDQEYIIYPNVSLGNNFTLSSCSVIDMTCFIIPSNSKYLLCLLNSKLTSFLMKIYAISRRGGYLEYKTQYLSKIPLKIISELEQQPFIALADQMLSLNEQLQLVQSKFVRLLERKFEIEASKALLNWQNLSFKEFTKELVKKKVKLSLADEVEWEEFFLAEQQKALSLQADIDSTDRTIDAKVYALYGLDEDEIALIESC